MQIELHENKKVNGKMTYVVSATRLSGSILAFYQTWKRLNQKFAKDMANKWKWRLNQCFADKYEQIRIRNNDIG